MTIIFQCSGSPFALGLDRRLSSSNNSGGETAAIVFSEWRPSDASSAAASSTSISKSSSCSSSKKEDTKKKGNTQEALAVASKKAQRSSSRTESLTRWLRFRKPLLLLLHVLLLLPLAAAEAPTAAASITEISFRFNSSYLQLQQDKREHERPQQQQRDKFYIQGSSPRRLSAAAAWAAELEGTLRLSPRLSLYIGIFLTLAGSLLMAGGSTLMKLGLSVEEEQRGYCDQQWLWGFAAYVFGAALHVIALGFAPASVLSPMNSIGLIANAVASATVLKEPFGFQEILFTGGCAFGVFLCACASVLPRTEFVDMGGDVDVRFIGLYSWRDPWYLAFLGLCCMLGFGALVYLNSVESALLEEREQQLLRGADRNVGMLALHGDGSKEGTSAEVLSPRGQNKQFNYPRLVGLCYGFLAGLVGSQCILEVKEIGTCVRYGLIQSSIWFLPQPYLVCVFLGLSVWMQIHFLNLGLARGDATTIVPTYYVVWTFFGTLGGFAKFHEVQGFSAWALVLFGLGFGLTAMCIILLAVEEMRNLRKYVDQQVPEIDEEDADLATQDLVEQRLSKRVTFAMGMFPISSLGRTAGRRKFRPIYQRFRRTRSTASDTALGDAYGELTIGSSSMAGAYTLPPNIHVPRTLDGCVVHTSNSMVQNDNHHHFHNHHHMPLHPLMISSANHVRNGDNTMSTVPWGALGHPDSQISRVNRGPQVQNRREHETHLMPPSNRSSWRSQYSQSLHTHEDHNQPQHTHTGAHAHPQETQAQTMYTQQPHPQETKSQTALPQQRQEEIQPLQTPAPTLSISVISLSPRCGSGVC